MRLRAQVEFGAALQGAQGVRERTREQPRPQHEAMPEACVQSVHHRGQPHVVAVEVAPCSLGEGMLLGVDHRVVECRPAQSFEARWHAAAPQVVEPARVHREQLDVHASQERRLRGRECQSPERQVQYAQAAQRVRHACRRGEPVRADGARRHAEAAIHRGVATMVRRDAGRARRVAQCRADPGSAVLRCCSASTLSGITFVIAALTLFFQPATTWSSPFFIAS